MMADSASEPDIMADDSGLCVYIRTRLRRPPQRENVLLRITATSTESGHFYICLIALWEEGD